MKNRGPNKKVSEEERRQRTQDKLDKIFAEKLDNHDGKIPYRAIVKTGDIIFSYPGITRYKNMKTEVVAGYMWHAKLDK